MSRVILTAFALCLFSTNLVEAAPRKKIQIFILAGQSNMEGHGAIDANKAQNNGQGSLEYLVKQDETAKQYEPTINPDGSWAERSDVRNEYLGR